MFGTKIKSWMEAQIARSRAKRKERASERAAGKVPVAAAAAATTAAAAQPPAAQTRLPLWNQPAGARRDEEACSTLFDPKFFLAPAAAVAADHEFKEILPALPASSSSFRGRDRSAQLQSQHHVQQQQQQQQHKASAAVNLSSPESAYSTGYSTDGTSPCATYAPEYYVKVRPGASNAAEPLQRQSCAVAEENRWRKPTPPKSSRPLAASQTRSPAKLLGDPLHAVHAADYPLQLFSPRRMPPLLASTSTQVTPARTSRSSSRARPVHRPARAYPSAQPDRCCRQESLSVGRSPVNRAVWRSCGSAALKQRLRANSASSCGSSRSSRSRSRSRSLSSGSSAGSSSSCCERNATAPLSTSSSLGSSGSSSGSSSEDDLTLNELMGKFDENCLCDKLESAPGSNSNGYSSSANFSSEASASSSLDRTSASRPRPPGRRAQQQQQQQQQQQRRRSSCSRQRSRPSQLESKEPGLLASRGFGELRARSAAETNRALLERLLMRRSSSRRCFAAKPVWGAAAAPSASRSLGGTPICLRRKNQLPVLRPPASLAAAAETSQPRAHPALESCASSLNDISASELALLEADQEADRKYAQLILEAERMLVNVQQQLQRDESASNSRRGSSASVATAPDSCSPSRFPRRAYLQQAYRQQSTPSTASAPNKRVELIKNAELNIELALLKSRNSQPELSSGSIKDLLDHSSPKRLLQQQQKKTIEPIQVAAAQTTSAILRADTNLFPAFQPIDVHPVASALTPQHDGKELSAVSEHYACPQSEPVKRKVYEDQQEGSRLLQHQAPPWLRNSDGDCTVADLQPQHQHLQSASACSSYSQLRKHALIETLQGLKQSLEDQSASLKLNCLRPI